MMVRPFDWRDIPLLMRYRHQGVYLNTASVVTRGSLVMPAALASLLSPPAGMFTCVIHGDDVRSDPLVGQCVHMPGSKFAQMTFLAPQQALQSPRTTTLLDYIAILCGERGALRLLAEVDEEDTALDALRKAGFAIYSRQRVWRLTAPQDAFSLDHFGEAGQMTWRVATPRDYPAIQALYSSVVPSLVQQTEMFEADKVHGLTLYAHGEIHAFVGLHYGYRGIWAFPCIHPSVENPALCLASLIHQIPYRLSRPLYFCVRSYQAWMEETMEALGAEPGPKQAVMVRHMALQARAMRSIAIPGMEGRQPEVTAPIANLEIK